MEAGTTLLKLTDTLLAAVRKNVLKKAVCSKSDDPTYKKMVLSHCSIRGKDVLQAEFFHTDNKATHLNMDLDEPDIADRMARVMGSWGQINLITTVGECEYRCSKSGNTVLIGLRRLEDALLQATAENAEETRGNNIVKNHILTGSEPFLIALGVSDSQGRIHDKKQSKFRQINRFLELVQDVESNLPAEGPLHICDLCCGKSYLSFAVYHYFANVLKREVVMTGVDLKSDVIAYCNEVARKVGFDGLTFECGDVGKYDTLDHVHMVVSLHACDTATDLVLERAMHWGAEIILSTPCCHHELNHTLNCPELAFIAEHSMLRQKFCDAATDALRLKLLEANGYEVEALELIDPEETPKNIMLRAVRSRKLDPNQRKIKKAREEYDAALEFLKRGTV